jgi:hypothetical protein
MATPLANSNFLFISPQLVRRIEAPMDATGINTAGREVTRTKCKIALAWKTRYRQAVENPRVRRMCRNANLALSRVFDSCRRPWRCRNGGGAQTLPYLSVRCTHRLRRCKFTKQPRRADLSAFFTNLDAGSSVGREISGSGRGIEKMRYLGSEPRRAPPRKLPARG